MSEKTILISINASWNIYNFRQGLIRALRAAGYGVAALAPRDAHSDRLAALGVDYHPIEMDKQGVSPARDLLLLRRYHHILGRIRPAVYLGYTAKPNIYGSLAAQTRGIPVINNVAGLGTAFIRDTWLTGVVKMLYRIAFRRSRIVFFQNQEDLDQFVRDGIVGAGRARLLPGSGIDCARFAPVAEPAGKAVRPFAFLLIGRLLWDKGVGEYVEAARLVREILPDARFRLLGPLDVANRTAVGRSDVEAWAAEGLIDYLGETDDVRPHIADADCIVLPSYREGLPRTLLEGAAMGKPLIATDVPGCRAVVEHGGNGLLCAARDARALARAMLEMARMAPEERARLGQAGRHMVETRFAEEEVARLYLEAIAEVLDGASRKT
jgi:glycosyltransferase involved in cell wall biosynthesis